MIDFSSFLVLDGGMGTLLQEKGLSLGGVPEVWNLEKPEIITGIHQDYVKAGGREPGRLYEYIWMQSPENG